LFSVHTQNDSITVTNKNAHCTWIAYPWVQSILGVGFYWDVKGTQIQFAYNSKF